MKIAVVGSGVSGLAATWLLNEYSEHEVHLFESASRPGGHANTVRFLPRNGKLLDEGVDVDTGFIVFNPSTYPNFLRFLQLHPSRNTLRSFLPNWLQASNSDGKENIDSGISILPTEMTFSVSRDYGAFEWAGKNLWTIFCQRRRLFDPHMWRMIYDILRFNICARRLLFRNTLNEEDISIGEFLDQEGYSESFRDNYLIPMAASIWSTPPDKCFSDFPAKTLVQFMYNHHLLQIIGKPSWLTIQGGSHKYVNKILSKLPQDQLHMSTAVRSLRNTDSENMSKRRVILTTEPGQQFTYDHVILACHSDTALQILRAGGQITTSEDLLLGAFKWNQNEAILHCDTKLMPKNRKAWSCWNYLSFTKTFSEEEEGYASDADTEDDLFSDLKMSLRSFNNEINEVSLTYGMNDLQHIPEAKHGPVLVTLNPPFEPDEDKIVGRWKYDHPVLDTKAVWAQNEMLRIQNTRSISYAGAYLKYGFHEDGFTSGLLAACSVDEDQNHKIYSNSKFDDLSIPVPRLTVHPPFEIQHADHYINLNRRSVENITYEILARIFDNLETTGIRAFVGVIGVIALTIFQRLLGIQDI